jgi:hypothetical protein
MRIQSVQQELSHRWQFETDNTARGFSSLRRNCDSCINDLNTHSQYTRILPISYRRLILYLYSHFNAKSEGPVLIRTAARITEMARLINVTIYFKRGL